MTGSAADDHARVATGASGFHDEVVEFRVLVARLLSEHHESLVLQAQILLLRSHVLHFALQTEDLIHFALAAVLRRYLVLTTSANVADQRQLRLGQVVLGETLVELVDRQVDDFQRRNWNVQRAGASLVTACLEIVPYI